MVLSSSPLIRGRAHGGDCHQPDSTEERPALCSAPTVISTSAIAGVVVRMLKMSLVDQNLPFRARAIAFGWLLRASYESENRKRACFQQFSRHLPVSTSFPSRFACQRRRYPAGTASASILRTM